MPYTFFGRTTFPKSTCQGSGFFYLYFFRTSTHHGFLQTFELLYSSSLCYRFSFTGAFFQTLLATCDYQEFLLVNRLNSQYGFRKYVDGNSIPTFCWMILTDFISVTFSFKKIIFNDSFFFVGEDHDFHKMAPTNVTPKITVNKKLIGFQAR